MGMYQKKEKFPNSWKLYSGNWHDGFPILLKIRDSIDHIIASNIYPERYVITWKLARTSDVIMSEAEADAVARFELKIKSALEKNQLAIFVAAATHNGERDWIFYCRNSDEAHRQLNFTLQNESIKPIEIMSCADPSWKEYKGILTNIARLNPVS
jgi:hypothetical protein